MNRTWMWIAFLLLSISACSSRTQSSSMAGPDNIFQVDALDQEFMTGQPAQLKASFSPDITLVDFGFGAMNGSASIGVVGRIPPDQIASNQVALALSNGPLADGFASVQMTNVGNPPDLSTGTVTFSVQADSVTGSVRSPSLQQPWNFHGTIIVSCWVPAAMVSPSERNTAGGTSGPNELLADQNFETQSCAPLRKWALK